MDMDKSSGITPLRAWVLAARPKTLAGAAVPVLIGCALAAEAGCFGWVPGLLCFGFAFLMQIDANLINDLFDYKKGSDGEDRLGPDRAVSKGWITPKAMTCGIVITTVAACVVGLSLLFFGGMELIVLGVVCVVFAFLYTAGPYPLAYHGWGDVLVLLFFGFVPVGGTYYVMCHEWTMSVGIASLASGLVVDTLLMVNNYRDRGQDARNGKRTLVVVWGARAGRMLYLLLGVVAVGLCLVFGFEGIRWAGLLPLLYLPLHVAAWRKMGRIGEGKQLNRLLGETSRNMLLFALLFSGGLLIG